MKKNRILALMLAASTFLTSSCTYRKNEPTSKNETYEVTQVIEMPIIDDYEKTVSTTEPTPTIESDTTTKTNSIIEPEVEEVMPNYNIITYKVQPGDTLYKISTDLYGDTSKIDLIIELNNLENPDIISVNQILKVPEAESLIYSELLEKTKYFSFEDEIQNLRDINNYGFLNNTSILFEGLNNMDNKEVINAYQKVFVLKANSNIALVLTDDGNTYYALASDISLLPENRFVEVDLSEQQTRLYLNNELAYSTANVTGKDSSPTDIGYFDIDGKAMGVTLTDNQTYWSYVNYWMPYNGGEGLHDADGWRSTYGGDIYHNSGSHGCVNMPLSAAEYIYNNVDVGTRVLVHK